MLPPKVESLKKGPLLANANRRGNGIIQIRYCNLLRVHIILLLVVQLYYRYSSDVLFPLLLRLKQVQSQEMNKQQQNDNYQFY